MAKQVDYEKIERSARVRKKVFEPKGRIYSQTAGICQRNFYLSGFPFRSQHRYIGKFSFGSHNGHSFIGKILPRLRQRSFRSQRVSEQT